MSHYKINSTAGKTELVLHPSATNTDTDLLLYGMGTLRWGRGVDQNLFRLLETFACPETANRFPGYTPTPKTSAEIEEDTGTSGCGINNPVRGQLWYNTDNNTIYKFNGIKWVGLGGVTSGEIPEAPENGDLWFPEIPGLGAGNTNATICNQRQLQIQDPDHCEADSKGWVSIAQNYIKRCGVSTVCGTLDFRTGVCDASSDDGCDPPGRIIGAIIQDAIIETTIQGNPDSVVSKKDVHKYVFPPSTRMLFNQSCAPIGWCVDASENADNRMVHVVNNGQNGIGGQRGGGRNPIRMHKNELPRHNHGSSIQTGGAHAHSGSTGAAGNHGHSGVTSMSGNHSHNLDFQRERYQGKADSNYGFDGGGGTSYSTHVAGNHNHSLVIYGSGNHQHTVSIASGGNHSHGIVNAYHPPGTTAPDTWEPRYCNVIICVKEGNGDENAIFAGGKKGTPSGGELVDGYCQ